MGKKNVAISSLQFGHTIRLNVRSLVLIDACYRTDSCAGAGVLRQLSAGHGRIGRRLIDLADADGEVLVKGHSAPFN
jgi:hypothetical protein